MRSGALLLLTIHASQPRWWAIRTVGAAAMVVLVAAAVHPAEGLALRLCWSARLVRVPCPGCGLTRSLSCAVRGDLGASLASHTLGPALAVALMLTAGLCVVPRGWIERGASAIAARPRSVRWACWGGFGVFLGYGVVRAAAHVLGMR